MTSASAARRSNDRSPRHCRTAWPPSETTQRKTPRVSTRANTSAAHLRLAVIRQQLQPGQQPAPATDAARACAGTERALPLTLPGPAHALHGLSETERYAFEVNGYIVIEDMIAPQQVAEMSAAFDAVGHDIITLRTLRTVSGGSDMIALSRGMAALEGTQGRGDTGELMQWPDPWCQPFRDLLSHPRTVRIMLDLVGEGFHYSSATGITMEKGTEGHLMHGGWEDLSFPAPGWNEYNCDRNGEIECNIINVMYQLADINPGDGGLVCIPGSHKAAFPCPTDVKTLDVKDDYSLGRLYRHVDAKAGSAVIFTEALTHGATPWLADHQRRTLMYRYAERGFNSGAKVEGLSGSNDVLSYAPFYEEMSPLGKAILEPAHYGNRPDIAALLEQQESKM